MKIHILKELKHPKHECQRDNWLILLCIAILSMGCSKYKRNEAVISRDVYEESQNSGSTISKKLLYQEFDKNDSLIYEIDFGPDWISDKKPRSITSRYFKNGNLVKEKIKVSYEKEPIIINVTYEDKHMVKHLRKNALMRYYYDNKRRLIREETTKNGNIQTSKNYFYKRNNQLPDIEQYWKGKLWNVVNNYCYGDTCVSFLKDSMLATRQVSLSIYNKGKLVATYYNDPDPPMFQLHDTSYHSTGQFDNVSIFIYNNKGKILFEKNYYKHKLFNTIVYKWDH